MYRLIKTFAPVCVVVATTLGMASLVPAPKPVYHTCLTDRENEKLGRVPDMRTAVDRLSLYEPLDPATFEKILKWSCRLGDVISLPPTNSTARRVDAIMVQMKKLVARMGTRVNEVCMPEFMDVSDDFCDTCDSYSSNLHMSLSSSSS